MAGRKLFVGSLPHGIHDSTLRQEFSKYGTIEDVFVKQGCEATRQWAFITYTAPEEAQRAKEATDRLLQFPGCDRPCDVMVAKHQGMFGQDPVAGGQSQAPQAAVAPVPVAHYAAPYATQYAVAYPAVGSMPAVAYAGPPAAVVSQSYTDAAASAKKVFVGSLPDAITDAELRAEFSKYGEILDVHVNQKPVEEGRQWAFITFANAEQAQTAKVSTDRQLTFPGSEKACEVTMARHQGMFGKEPITADSLQPVQQVQYQAVVANPGMPAVYAAVPQQSQGARKIFVGSLPNNVTDASVSAEFSKYGQVVDIHLNGKACEPGRNWAFITYASAEQAAYAKDATDRVLTMPGADRACEVMLAKNQGKFGQEPLGSSPAPVQAFAAAPMPYSPTQPPPPPTAPPTHLTPWRMYKTAAGLPYYHNHATGQTTWECPPDLQVPGQPT
eukprot:CAMPEP_0168467818 /NCGR_PEP_ID=MMETSP0228-20121227/57386_1 /TAXON_ID=133427 /ORGANISM="Protoceratium reticulatum, Strain CCCM 535 (=CCMP 1889)" /LENGTH=441 /DNA_ID=CAMNT_0008483555 /DNA_START=63 /DNA_END=1385 /DNA_ORIENTATION=+